MRRFFSLFLAALLFIGTAPAAFAAEAADILARDLCDAAKRIFAVAPAGPQILSYCGAGRDVYPELLTYATALFLCRHYDHIIENPQTHTPAPLI